MSFNDDVRRLAGLIAWIHKVLDTARERVPPELREKFDAAWPEIAEVLESAESEVLAIKNENSSRWRQLAAHGLTGVQLDLKLAVRDLLVKLKVWDDVLDYINSLLASLGLDIVGEYKDALLASSRHAVGSVVIPGPITA